MVSESDTDFLIHFIPSLGEYMTFIDHYDLAYLVKCVHEEHLPESCLLTNVLISTVVEPGSTLNIARTHACVEIAHLSMRCIIKAREAGLMMLLSHEP